MRIYAQARGAPTPALNALATLMLLVSLLALVLAYFVFRFMTRGENAAAAARRRAGDVRGRRGTVMADQGDIRLVELTKRYGEVTAVDGIDLHMPSGEFFTMLGPSGCGKTTTLRLIAGFERPTAARSCSTASTWRARRRTSGASTRSSRATRCSRTRPCATTSPSGCATSG